MLELTWSKYLDDGVRHCQKQTNYKQEGNLGHQQNGLTLSTITNKVAVVTSYREIFHCHIKVIFTNIMTTIMLHLLTDRVSLQTKNIDTRLLSLCPNQYDGANDDIFSLHINVYGAMEHVTVSGKCLHTW